MNAIMSVVTAEFFLKHRPNGGKAVLMRSLFISIYIYLIAIGLKSYTSETAVFAFSLSRLPIEVNSTIPWAGAIFGAVYAALYTRFSSQWSYLADLYNQLLSAAVTLGEEHTSSENYSIWQAAFVEDAVCMHLALKPGFSNAVLGMIKEDATREILEEDSHFGKEKVAALIKTLENAVSKKL